MYIHKQKNWPNFSWNNEAILEMLVPLRHYQGVLIGKMESLGFDLRKEALLQTLTQDVIKSSEIEGENLDLHLVRSSIARRLGMDQAGLHKTDRSVEEGVVEMLLDATQNYSAPLTKERLFSWHSSLFSGDFKDARLLKIAVGEWRKGPVEVISGYYGKETIHFEGPSGEKVEKEMATFLEWFNEHSFIDPVLKAGIAHFYFVTIHPFEDGNGRIARAIADQMLARSEKSSQRYYSLSSQIQLERKHYYAVLEQSQKADLDITLWLKWFLGCLERAMSRAEQTLSKVIDKDQFWKKTGDVKFNDRQKKIVNLLLDGFEGNLSTSKWAKIAKCSQDTAYRDILQLMRLGVLVPSSEKGRSTHYLLKKEKLGLSL